MSMTRLNASYTVLALCAVLVAGCGRAGKPLPVPNGAPNSGPSAAADPAQKPTPPLSLQAPAPLPHEVDGEDLKAMDPLALLARANRAMNGGDYDRAAKFQYWYVQKTQSGQYNLTCFLALTGQKDAAFYFLQTAALEEGVDTPHAQRDSDLASLRADPRWKQVQPFLAACNRYFETAPIGRVALVLPAGYQVGTPIPAVVWLHGLGSRPDDFVDEGVQEYADALNVAFIGVSGTKPRGPRSFVWAMNNHQDYNRIHAALEEVKDRVTIEPGKLIAIGFSQGALVGMEIAALRPDEYAGAIVLSPGGDSHLNTITPSPLMEKRLFVVTCGANEHPHTVETSTKCADWLRGAKAEVLFTAHPGVSAHSFPRDFHQQFPEWVKQIMSNSKQ